MLQAPAVFLSLLLASLLAIGFHLLVRGSLRDLLLFWLSALVGFACGQWAGERLAILPWSIGQIRIVEALLGSTLFILTANWLRPQDPRP